MRPGRSPTVREGSRIVAANQAATRGVDCLLSVPSSLLMSPQPSLTVGLLLGLLSKESLILITFGPAGNARL
jgi:hypothetical protein